MDRRRIATLSLCAVLALGTAGCGGELEAPEGGGEVEGGAGEGDQEEGGDGY